MENKKTTQLRNVIVWRKKIALEKSTPLRVLWGYYSTVAQICQGCLGRKCPPGWQSGDEGG